MLELYIFGLKSDQDSDEPTYQTIPADGLQDALEQLFDLGYEKDGVHYVLEGDDWRQSYDDKDLTWTIDKYEE